MIEERARAAVERRLAGLEAAAAELAPDVAVERDGERITLIGRGLRLRALTDARIIGLLAGGGR